MKISEVRAIARQHHLQAGKATKRELIRAIQRDEGNQPCFDSNSSGQCGQGACLWREDCHRVERSIGSFSRKLHLPVEIQVDKAKASSNDGVLEIRMPKSEPEKQKVRKINVE